MTLATLVYARPGHPMATSNVTTRPVITIVMASDHPIPETSLRAMKFEVRRILSPVANVEWRPLETVATGDTFAVLAVSRFTGWCEVGADSRAAVNAPLGKAAAGGQGVLPFFKVDCDAVRGMLLHEMPTENTPRLQFSLGVGLARIVAHEVYHVLLNTPEHGRGGVAKAALTSWDLFIADLRFEPEQLSDLAAALAKSSEPDNSVSKLVPERADVVLRSSLR